MKKVDLTNYMVMVKAPNPDVPNGPPVDKEIPYFVKNSLIELLFIPKLQLSGAELVRANMLAVKLESCTEDSILLEDSEWERLQTAINTHTGYTRQDVKFVDRVLGAEAVEVEIKGVKDAEQKG